MTNAVLSDPKALGDSVCAKVLDDLAGFAHARTMTNFWSLRKTTQSECGQKSCHATLRHMEELADKPYADIAKRLLWHRQEVERLTQNEYAKVLGVKRSTLNNWESGDYRLSLNGAIALRRRYGLSLDFMYEGIDDALPMTLRKAWLDKP